MFLDVRRTQSFTHRDVYKEQLSRAGLVRLVPANMVGLYVCQPVVNERVGAVPLVTNFPSISTLPVAFRKPVRNNGGSTSSMTRLFFNPSRSGDIRSRTSINRSSSASNIPSLYSYNNNNNNDISISRLSLNNDMKYLTDYPEQRHHRYAQQQQQNGFSKSASSLLPVIQENPGRSSSSVARSQSFSGINSDHNPRPAPSPPVLGDTIKRNNRSSLKLQNSFRSLRKPNKTRKIPCPNRTMMAIDCVKQGITECIQKTYDDVAYLISSENSASTTQKIKSAERYLAKLEFHLAKIDELKDCYMLNQQMREGARNMAQAFNDTNSNCRKDSISSLKYGYKECSQAMCAIESELESVMGTLTCKLKGIAGFARVVPKDVFEVVVKYGYQKWKSKGKIEKDSAQKWDCPDYTFKCLVGEALQIKASEVRAFKSVLLGQKNCEIWNPFQEGTSNNQSLFSPCSQLMTINITDNGSLKLSVIFTWNPLGNMDDSAGLFQSTIQRAVSTSNIWHSSNQSLNGSLSSSSLNLTGSHDRKYKSPMQHSRYQSNSAVYGSATSLPNHLAWEVLHHHQFKSASPIMRASSSQWKSNYYNGHLRPYSFTSFDVRKSGSHDYQPSSPTSALSDSSCPHSINSSFNTERTSPQISSSLSQPALNTRPSVTSEITQAMIPGLTDETMEAFEKSLTVGEALDRLKTSLEDYLGHYSELQKLEEVVQVINSMIRKPLILRSRSSSINISIDGAIEEAFDFLNTEELPDDFDDENEKGQIYQMNTEVANIEKIIVSPNSTANTADSGIESLAKCLQEDIHLGSSRGSSPVSPSSGNEQVDQAFVFHLVFCDRLLKKLGNFGPLKCQELYALDHLQKQAVILVKLVDIAKSGPDVDLHTVLSVETSDKSLRELWMLCVDENPLYAHPEKVISIFEQKFCAKLLNKHDVRPIRIFQQIMAHMLYVAQYVPEVGRTSIVTLNQCMLFFKNSAGLKKMEEIAEELHIMDMFNSSSCDVINKTISTLPEKLPSPVCLKVLMKLLVSKSHEMRQSVKTYVKNINKNKAQRDKVLVVLLEGLEDRIADVRAGCCVALSILEAEECLNQLVYISQSDKSPEVCKQAKEVLYSFGDVGRKAIEDAQLSSHGFQGFHMHKPSVKRKA